MKKTLYTFLAAVLLSTGATHGLDLDAVTSFSGEGTPAGKFYYDCKFTNLDFVFGFSAQIPGSKADRLGTDLLLGVNANLPLLDNVDVYFTNGTLDVGEFFTESLAVSKKWMYSINDNVSLGLQATLAEVMLDGSKKLNILSDISPVLGVQINL